MFERSAQQESIVVAITDQTSVQIEVVGRLVHGIGEVAYDKSVATIGPRSAAVIVIGASGRAARNLQ